MDRASSVHTLQAASVNPMQEHRREPHRAEIAFQDVLAQLSSRLTSLQETDVRPDEAMPEASSPMTGGDETSTPGPMEGDRHSIASSDRQMHEESSSPGGIDSRSLPYVLALSGVPSVSMLGDQHSRTREGIGGRWEELALSLQNASIVFDHLIEQGMLRSNAHPVQVSWDKSKWQELFSSQLKEWTQRTGMSQIEMLMALKIAKSQELASNAQVPTKKTLAHPKGASRPLMDLPPGAGTEENNAPEGVLVSKIPAKSPSAWADWVIDVRGDSGKEARTAGHGVELGYTESPDDLGYFSGASHETGTGLLGSSPQNAASNMLTPQTAPQANGAFSEILVKNAQYILREGRSEFLMILEPDHLGVMRVRLAVEDASIIARLVVESQEAREMIESNMSDLRDALHAAGLDIRELEVSVGHEFPSAQRDNMSFHRDKGYSYGGASSNRTRASYDDSVSSVTRYRDFRYSTVEFIG